MTIKASKGRKVLFIIVGITLLLIALFFVYQLFSAVDFSNPQLVLEKYIEYNNDGKYDKAYDKFLSVETKKNSSKSEFLSAVSKPDSVRKAIQYSIPQISEIPVDNPSFKRYKVLELGKYKDKGKDVEDKYLNYYTLKNDDGKWHIVWIYSTWKLATEECFSANYRTSLDLLKRCVQINPYHGNSYEYIGWCYARDNSVPFKERESKVLENAKLAISLEEDRSQHYNLLSQYYNQVGNSDLSIEALKRGLSFCLNESSKSLFYQNISQQYLSIADYSNAESFAKKAIDIDDQETFSWYVLGKTQHSKNDIQNALKSYEKALKLGKMESDRQSDLYANYAILNNYYQICDSAKEYIMKAISLSPDNKSYQQLRENFKKCGFSQQYFNVLN